jgi:hypothetical protein
VNARDTEPRGSLPAVSRSRSAGAFLVLVGFGLFSATIVALARRDLLHAALWLILSIGALTAALGRLRGIPPLLNDPTAVGGPSQLKGRNRRFVCGAALTGALTVLFAVVTVVSASADGVGLLIGRAVAVVFLALLCWLFWKNSDPGWRAAMLASAAERKARTAK